MSHLSWDGIWNSAEQQNYRKKGIGGLEVDNPMLELIEDTPTIRKVFKEFGIIPYYGTRQQSKNQVLWLFDQLATFSPSANACISGRKKGCFGGLIDAQLISSDGFVLESAPDDISKTQKKEFFDWLRSFGVTGHDIKRIATETESSYLNNGNSWVVATLTEVGTEQRATFKVYPQSWCHYLEKENPLDVEQVLITPKLDKKYWKDNPPMVVDIYESFDRVQFNDGGVATVAFHNKNNSLIGLKYGLPESIGSLYNQFNEWQNGDYLIRETANSMIGRVFFFLQKEEEAASSASGDAAMEEQMAADSIRRDLNNTVVKGSKDGKAVNALFYPFNTEAPKTLIIPPNTNEKWYKEIKAYNSSYVYSSLGWSALISGLEKPTSSLNGSSAISDLKVANVMTIKPSQNRKSMFLGRIFSMLSEWSGNDISKEVGVKFKSPYEELLQMEDAAEVSNTTTA